jgi:hypothetical protein
MIIAIPATARRLSRRRMLLAAAAAFAALPIAPPARAVTELVVHDVYSGVAIGGYDPVAYFLYGEPRAGDPENEVEWGGAYWHFENKGNAAAFVDAPAVYVPAYGGYGVLGVSRGQPQEGDPTLFAIHGDRLFLFHSAADRDAFLADPEGLVALADARWPKVRDLLAR